MLKFFAPQKITCWCTPFSGEQSVSNMGVCLVQNYMLQVGKEIGIVKDNPRLLVIVSHSFVEMMVKSLLDYHIPEAKLKNHYQRLEILKQKSVIDDFQFKLYDWFRELRNDAVHTPIFRLKDSDFHALHNLVKKDQLGVDNFHSFSLKLIAELWNKNLDVLGEAYLSKYC
ncbi:DUF4145 domain-containing protein [Nitrincola sp. A-D6]|uniref:DUF4145 domain-containing protein n=1 Tax=Nitrincola sp. A-D6 TaxID=1545442 RepID=UPI001186A29C|nr:DUF4145 domain-containing protein [Nitrincola sp. A-D6]